jgi:prepilin peptidase CpaA
MVLVIQYLLFAFFPVAMAYAAASDLLTMTIPNRLNLALLAGFLVIAPLSGMGWTEFGYHWAAAAVVLALGFGCFAFGWVGGGDAKLAAIIALWLGGNDALMFVALASIIGGALTLVLLRFRTLAMPNVVIRQPWVQRLHDSRTGVPYGIALAAAALILYPHSVWTQLVLG